MLKLHVLASGSGGNASVVEDADTGRALLIDDGISKKAFTAACDAAGFDPARIEAVLITHEHTDHTKGLGVLLRGLAKLDSHPVVYCNDQVFRASTAVRDAVASVSADVLGFSGESELSIAGMDVFPFVTSHDAAASFGFRIQTGSDALGFMTDTGYVTPQAHDHLKSCRILAIEGNHDLDMLEHGPYPYVIKRRIASDRGHLSNDQGSIELHSLLHNGLEQVVAMHISQNNNTYDLPREAFSATLAQEGHTACVTCGYQARVTSVE